MQTAIYIRSLLHGGAEKQALLLTKELQKNQNTLLIVHTHDEKIASQDFSGINQIIFLKGGNLKKIIDLYILLKKHHVTNLICFLPVNNIIGTLVARLSGVPNVLCGIRGPKYKGNFRTSILRFICNTLKVKFISNSYLSKSIYENLGFDNHQIKVIHNAVVVPEINAGIVRTIRNKSTFSLLTVGRYIGEKDFETLLDAIHILVTTLNFTRIHLKLVGYGPLKTQLGEKITELGLSSYVTMYDGRTEDIKAHYLSSDLYILSSISEGMPNTVMEAMSYKLPIVSTDAGDVAYLVSDDNGVLVKPKNSRAIAAGVKSILESETQYQELSNRSFQKISEGFSVHKMTAGFMEFLK